MLIKTATGDFNNDGFANEVAVLATDNNGIYMWMYRIEYNDGTFTIKTMKDKTTIFSYRYPDYFKKWSYNGWNRTPGADILAGDFDGDGKDEIAFAGYRSDLFYKVKDVDATGYQIGADRHAEYKVRPYLSLVKIDSDGKLKSSRIFEGDPIIDKRYTSYNGQDDNNTSNWNAFNLEEYILAPVAQDAELHPIADREISIAAGTFFGQAGLAKERDDVALRIYGGKMLLFKSNGSTLTNTQTLPAEGTSALVAGDFASEGIELGDPTFITRTRDKTYMAVIQAPPFHVDTVSADGKAVTAKPVNFSFTVTRKKVPTSYKCEMNCAKLS